MADDFPGQPPLPGRVGQTFSTGPAIEPPLARVRIQSACWTAADSLAPPTTDVDLIARLSERNGVVAAAFAIGHGSLESEVMDPAGTCLAWLEQAETRRVEPRRSAV